MLIKECPQLILKKLEKNSKVVDLKNMRPLYVYASIK